MIPVRLVLRNFLSYAEPDPLDFTRFDVACLTGPNGAGKSTLLDAMTWAIFAAARGCEGGQHQDRLIRDGADEVSVELTFEVGETTYQIVRRRTRSGKADVRFMALGADGWTNLAADSMRQTDDRIASLLRMDYTTFVTSAFFVQGRADDFLARMKPEERKEVFARLLDLGTYERLESAARQRSREAERVRSDRAAQAERLAQAAEDPEALEAELVGARREADEAASVLDVARDATREMSERVAELNKVEALREHRRRSLEEASRRAEAENTAVTVREGELAGIDAILERSGEAEPAATEAERLREEDRVARAAQARAAGLREQASMLTERIRAEGEAVSKRLREDERAAAKLEKEIVTLGRAETQLVELDAMLEASGDLESELERTTERVEAERVAQTAASERLAAVSARADETREKLDLLASKGGRCPLCGEALDATHRRTITKELRARTKELAEEARGLSAEAEMARKEGRRLGEEVKRLDKARRDRQRAESARSGLVVKVERAAAARAELETQRQRMAADEGALHAGTFAAEARGELEALESRIADTYDAGAHERVLGRLAELAPLQELGARIREAAGLRETLVRDLQATRARAAEAEEEAARHRADIEAVAGELELLPRLRKELERLGADVTGASAAAAERSRRVAQLEERLGGARVLAAQTSQTRREEAEAASSRLRYYRLATAFGRGGIPDRIIENALPDLRDDANDILGRLSDYEMSLQFVMSKDTKSGKTKETFDVLVHHDGGVRDFQMFSGGEAFRIAFAVRLALSKLLAKRAGARLETLVVDEGFGTQDPVGRERLVEAVNLARGEFAKVLVITHLEELKGMFDTQIRVTKDDPVGSRLEVVS